MKKTLAAVAAIAAAGALTSAPVEVTAQPEVSAQKSAQKGEQNRGTSGSFMEAVKAAFTGGYRFNSRGSERRRGPGWTQAHVKRMARKARNVKRFKAAQKGRR